MDRYLLSLSEQPNVMEEREREREDGHGDHHTQQRQTNTMEEDEERERESERDTDKVDLELAGSSSPSPSLSSLLTEADIVTTSLHSRRRTFTYLSVLNFFILTFTIPFHSLHGIASLAEVLMVVFFFAHFLTFYRSFGSLSFSLSTSISSSSRRGVVKYA